MGEAKHAISDLYQMQSLPLSAKIRMTQLRIRGWVEEYGEDGVYVSFSGGKDSTVLLDIVRIMYPDIPAVFVDTGLEYPEIREFVKRFDNVEWLKPKLTFRQVIEKYGYPFISKEVSETVYYARKYLKSLENNNAENIITARERVPYCAQMADILSIDRRKDKNNLQYNLLKKGIIPSVPIRYQILCGEFKHKEKGVETGEISRMYDRSRYKFFLDAPFEISQMCCKIMKKEPLHSYSKKTGRKPITAQMASESKVRTQKWLKNGCNGFEMKNPISNPMSFWTEQDVLLYIKENDLPICSVYGNIVEDYAAQGQVDGQINLSDIGIFDIGRPLLKTTGCSRTGCMFCGYGCHLEKSPGRFERMKITHPKIYEYIMKPWSEGGLGYREIIDWINEHGNLNIKY